MKFLKVANWKKFQHYKDRCPPWIKLHRDLLRSYDFRCLQDDSKLHLMLIWLLASQLDNKIPADEKYIREQIGVSGKINFNELINKGFLIDDSNTLAGRKQSAIVETEAETYSKETEKKESCTDFEEFWKSWIPYKTGKGSKKDAYDAYDALVLTRKEISHEELIRISAEYCKFCQTTDCNTRNVHRWLKKRGWEDDYTIPTRPTSNGGNATDNALRDRVNETAQFIDSLCGDERG
ncbi:MAG: hypothetical protein ACUZ8H_05370 [Candidatus Anammoxibacter sp.]